MLGDVLVNFSWDARIEEMRTGEVKGEQSVLLQVNFDPVMRPPAFWSIA